MRPISFLIIPLIASSQLVSAASDKPGSVSHLASDRNKKSVPGSPILGASVDSRLDKGTKDAPVDGQDGKPHAGPFLESGIATGTGGKNDLLDREDLPIKGKSSSHDKGTSIKGTSSSPGVPDDDPGVMREDKRPAGSIKGPTGTEGGVSSKDKDHSNEAKTPEKPKEAKKLEDVTSGTKKSDSTIVKGAAGLEKPNDLPDSPHDVPHPKPYIRTTPSKIIPAVPDTDEILKPLHSLVLSFSMIIFSEIGDKTFLVAALMAMRHDRSLVFSAAFSALVLMTILSALLGHAVPAFLPKRLTTAAAAVLFLIFGFKLLREGLAMSKEAGVGEEMLEVEMELEEKEAKALKTFGAKRRGSNGFPNYLVESGRRSRSSSSALPAPARSPSTSPSPPLSPTSVKSSAGFGQLLQGLNNLCGLLLSPAWVQTFVMTFLGEWGDRSQIATIAMAAGKDYWFVTIGAITGHAICTAIAVIGGRAIAGKVSMRLVTIGGGLAFLLFGIIYGAEVIWGHSNVSI